MYVSWDDPLNYQALMRGKATLMKILGANTIRVYTVDATADHTGCMSAFESAGIYLLVALDSPTASINRVCHHNSKDRQRIS